MDTASQGNRPPGTRGRLTSRAAVLAVVICAIALSLAYPVREYVAQRRQIDQLVAEQQMMEAQVQALLAKRAKLTDPAYIREMAGEELHMCMPSARCYVIEGTPVLAAPRPQAARPAPWYAKLWQSVREANKEPALAGKTSPVTSK